MRIFSKIGFVIVVTIGILFTLEYCIENAMSNVREGEMGKINAVVRHELDHEVTIWGASTAYVHFDAQKMTNELGLSVFNMGIDGTNIDQYYGLLKEYLEYTNKSKYLVIALDVHGGFMKREALYNIHNWTHHFSNSNINNCFSSIDYSLMWKCKYVPFYKLTVYNKHNFRYVRNNLTSTQGSYNFPRSGYSPNPVNNHNLDEVTGEDHLVDIDTTVYNKLSLACELAKAKNIQPIIIITPCYSKGFNRLKNAKEVVSKIQGFSQIGVKVFNYSQSEISKDAKLFNDFTHLNKVGAAKLSSMFVKDFKKEVLNLD
jgi:hypothetical protein